MTLKKICSALAIVGISAIAAAAQSGWAKSSATTTGDLVAVYFTSADNGWVAGDNGYLASTSDGGRSWAKFPLGTTEDINEIYFRNEKNGYLVAGRKMFITSDAGATWRETQLYRPGAFKNAFPEFLSIRFADKKRGLAIGSLLNSKGNVLDSLVMRTDDGGDTWTRIVVPAKVELFHLDFNGSDNGWIVGDKGLILATTDGGMTWRAQASGATRALFNVDFRDDSFGFAVGGGGTILRTEDGGAHWDKIATKFTDTFKRVDFADDKNGWIVGHNGTVLRSADRGRSWIRQESSVTGNLYGLFMTKKYGWAVGSDGTIITYQK
ncbi:MAG: YCF48-related protein [Acidobacteriota bacterium]